MKVIGKEAEKGLNSKERDRSETELIGWRRMTSDAAPGSRTPLSFVNMAAEDVIVDNFVKFWRIPAVRRYFHWMFVFITIAGSILKELDVVPQSYFSHRRNIINMYVALWC